MVSFLTKLTKVLWILYGVAFSPAVGQLFVAGKEQTSGLDGLSTGRELISQKNRDFQWPAESEKGADGTKGLFF